MDFLNGTGTGQTETFIPPNRTQNQKKLKVETLPTFKVQPLFQLLESKKDKIKNYKKLLGNLITEGDLCIFWGTSGSGKSIFSYQLGECISKGINFFDVMSECEFETDTGEKPYYKLKNTSDPQKVLYVDFEMSPEQLTGRYCNMEENKETILYKHNPNLEILKFDSRSIKDKTQYLLSIEKYVKETGTKVVIIDNLSNISVRGEEGDFVLNLMNLIKDIQERNGLTMILISHSIKVNPLDKKSDSMLRGSSMYKITIDSMFCLSETTKETGIRYLIQQKCRYGETQFGENNVIEIELIKNKKNGNIGFVFNGYGYEDNLLKPQNTDMRQLLKQEVKTLMETETNMTYYNISKMLYPTYGNGGKESTFLKQCERTYNLIKRENEK